MLRRLVPLVAAFVVALPLGASGPDPAPPPAAEEAKAVVTLLDGSPVPDAWPAGRPLALSSRDSTAGDHPRSVRWTVRPGAAGRDAVLGDGGRAILFGPVAEPGTVAVTLTVARSDTLDVATVEIRIEAPGPASDPALPRPPPGPAPSPQRPRPRPPADALAKAAAEYRWVVPAVLARLAKDVRSGQVADINGAIGLLEKLRVPAAKAFGTQLDDALRRVADAGGAFTDREAAAGILESAAAAMGGR